MIGNSKLVFWLPLSGVSLIVVVGASYIRLVGTSPLTFDPIDFDRDGSVTFSELVYANAYGTRQVTENSRTCTEYYALKDGLWLKIVCNGDEYSSAPKAP